MSNTIPFKNILSLQEINQWMLPNQLAGHLGIKFTDVTAHSVSAQIQVSEIHSRPGGIMSGGTTLAMIETVASVAGVLMIDPKTHNVFGIEVSANHVRQVKLGETITATATADHAGQTTQVWSVRITDGREKLVCIGRITLFVAERSTKN